MTFFNRCQNWGDSAAGSELKPNLEGSDRQGLDYVIEVILKSING